MEENNMTQDTIKQIKQLAEAVALSCSTIELLRHQLISGKVVESEYMNNLLTAEQLKVEIGLMRLGLLRFSQPNNEEVNG